MTQSETIAALTAEDIAKLKEKKMGSGCLWVTGVPALLIFLFFLFNAQLGYTFDFIWLAAAFVVPLLLIVPLYMFLRKNDRDIDADITGGKKTVITAPITEKRINSTDITRGREKGGISSEYFMTVAGAEYPMNERKYLTIPVGEFMEMHVAPVSKIVVRERWLKQDGTSEDAGEP